MPRSVDLLMESPATVEQVHSAFSEQEYWLARLSAFGGSTTLDSLVVDADGTVTVATTQDLRHELLPGMLGKFYPNDLKILRSETWKPVGASRVRGQVSVRASGAPGSGRGTALLESHPDGSQLTFTATVEVKIPLVGGRIESWIAGQLTEEIPAIQSFTTDWITENA
jgi:hypothetical protein